MWHALLDLTGLHLVQFDLVILLSQHHLDLLHISLILDSPSLELISLHLHLLNLKPLILLQQLNVHLNILFLLSDLRQCLLLTMLSQSQNVVLDSSDLVFLGNHGGVVLLELFVKSVDLVF